MQPLFDLAPCGLVVLDREYRILHANAWFLDLVGLTAHDLTAGVRLGGLLSVAGRIFLQTRLQQELALAGRVEELALDLVRPDGVRVPAMLNAQQATDAAGRPSEIRMAIWRAAAKRAYEAEVPKAREAAEAAGRVKADFLANISHELRTPLNGVLGVAGVLARTPLSADQQRMVATIEDSAHALARLVGDILDVSKVQAGQLGLEPRPFDLATEFAGVLEFARLQAQAKGLTFGSELPSDVGPRLGDAVRLKQILGALLSNAVKFTERGGVGAFVSVDGDELAMRVEDTGVGFDPARIDLLFGGFEQVESGLSRRHGGAGLGLTIAKGLVELMGGAISARSTPGLGSTFEVRVPLPAAAGPPDEAAPEAPADERPLSVLLVEDNPTNRQVVELILSGCDVSLSLAENGQLGLDAWREGLFDLVLMDLQMPVMDGLTAIREIRRLEALEPRRGRTPVAVLSANAMAHHQAEALAAGADLHIAKPVSPAALISGIQAALEAAARAA